MGTGIYLVRVTWQLSYVLPQSILATDLGGSYVPTPRYRWDTTTFLETARGGTGIDQAQPPPGLCLPTWEAWVPPVQRMTLQTLLPHLPGRGLSYSHAGTHLILTATHASRYYCQAHFADEDTEVYREVTLLTGAHRE